jgi:hypothetical protein
MEQVALCNRGRSIDRVTALPCLLQPLISLRLESKVVMSKTSCISVMERNNDESQSGKELTDRKF